VNTFDEAFESRIHLSINYTGLTQESRREVWANFFNRMKREDRDVSEEDIDAFSRKDINGRVIKNVMKTAGLVADSKNEPLKASHIDTVLNLWDASSRVGKN